MNKKLKIIIDPFIKDRYGPEICWTWRLLLSSLGYCWEEVHPDCEECDVLYSHNLRKFKNSRFFVHANLDLWDQKCSLRLENIASSDGLLQPLFQTNSSTATAATVYDGRIICERDFIFDVFWLVTGQEEKLWPKDEHGFFDLSGTPFLERQTLSLALGSDIGRWLEKKFLSLDFTCRIPRWPANKKAAAGLSHDVDYPEVHRLLEPIRIFRRQGFGGLKAAASIISGKRNHWHFTSWTETEKQLGLRSAFYFVAVPGSLLRFALGVPDPFYDIKSKRYKELLTYLTIEGFEIGLHASYLAFTSEERFEAEKETLEQYSGQEVRGNRHHYWHLNPNDIESTLMLHGQIGLKYDTSLIHERYIGWRRNMSWPFFPFHHQKRREVKTLQVQTTWMDNQLFQYLRYNVCKDRFNILQTLINTTSEQGGCLLVDIHNYVFDNTLYPGWKNTYIWLVRKLIESSDFWVATPGEIADHWLGRYSYIRDNSIGLSEGD